MENTVDIIALKKKIIEKGYDTNTKLAEDANISRNTLGTIVKGKAYPSTSIIYKLASVLSLTPQEIGEIFFSSNLRKTQNSTTQNTA